MTTFALVLILWHAAGLAAACAGLRAISHYYREPLRLDWRDFVILLVTPAIGPFNWVFAGMFIWLARRPRHD